MRDSCIFSWVILLTLLGQLCKAQSDFDVSDPRFELKENHLLIHFDILDSRPSESFDISMDITDENGSPIDAKALVGDIGSNVSGGNNKLITWDLEEDNIVMNAEIIVNIYARINTPQPPVPATTEEKKKRTGEYNRTGLILQSLTLPGLGLSRATGKPHWIRGVAGYGCIAGSIALNRTAVSNYDDFLAAETTEDSDYFMARATWQDNISEVLVYTAIGIWVADFLWTMLGTRDLNRISLHNETKAVKFTAGIDPLIKAPMVGLNLRF